MKRLQVFLWDHLRKHTGKLFWRRVDFVDKIYGENWSRRTGGGNLETEVLLSIMWWRQRTEVLLSIMLVDTEVLLSIMLVETEVLLSIMLVARNIGSTTDDLIAAKATFTHLAGGKIRKFGANCQN